MEPMASSGGPVQQQDGQPSNEDDHATSMESDEVTTASNLPPLSKPVTNGLNASSPCEMKMHEEASTRKDAITTVNNSEHKNENDDTQSNVTSQTTSSQKIKSEQDSVDQLLNNATPCDTQAALIPDQTNKQTATTPCKTKAQSSPKPYYYRARRKQKCNNKL